MSIHEKYHNFQAQEPHKHQLGDVMLPQMIKKDTLQQSQIHPQDIWEKRKMLEEKRLNK